MPRSADADACANFTVGAAGATRAGVAHDQDRVSITERFSKMSHWSHSEEARTSTERDVDVSEREILRTADASTGAWGAALRTPEVARRDRAGGSETPAPKWSGWSRRVQDRIRTWLGHAVSAHKDGSSPEPNTDSPTTPVPQFRPFSGYDRHGSASAHHSGASPSGEQRAPCSDISACMPVRASDAFPMAYPAMSAGAPQRPPSRQESQQAPLLHANADADASASRTERVGADWCGRWASCPTVRSSRGQELLDFVLRQRDHIQASSDRDQEGRDRDLVSRAPAGRCNASGSAPGTEKKALETAESIRDAPEQRDADKRRCDVPAVLQVSVSWNIGAHSASPLVQLCRSSMRRHRRASPPPDRDQTSARAERIESDWPTALAQAVLAAESSAGAVLTLLPPLMRSYALVTALCRPHRDTRRGAPRCLVLVGGRSDVKVQASRLDAFTRELLQYLRSAFGIAGSVGAGAANETESRVTLLRLLEAAQYTPDYLESRYDRVVYLFNPWITRTASVADESHGTAATLVHRLLRSESTLFAAVPLPMLATAGAYVAACTSATVDVNRWCKWVAARSMAPLAAPQPPHVPLWLAVADSADRRVAAAIAWDDDTEVRIPLTTQTSSAMRFLADAGDAILHGEEGASEDGLQPSSAHAVSPFLLHDADDFRQQLLQADATMRRARAHSLLRETIAESETARKRRRAPDPRSTAHRLLSLHALRTAAAFLAQDGVDAALAYLDQAYSAYGEMYGKRAESVQRLQACMLQLYGIAKTTDVDTCHPHGSTLRSVLKRERQRQGNAAHFGALLLVDSPASRAGLPGAVSTSESNGRCRVPEENEAPGPPTEDMAICIASIEEMTPADVEPLVRGNVNQTMQEYTHVLVLSPSPRMAPLTARCQALHDQRRLRLIRVEFAPFDAAVIERLEQRTRQARALLPD
eukprot:ctg_1112.g351